MSRMTLKIHSHPELNSYFYDDRMREIVARLQYFTGARHQVHLFPEATIKNNKLPNGILVESPANQTLLMPGILRDPGCGFILFKLNQVTQSQLSAISGHIMAFCQQLEASQPVQQDFLVEAMQYGTRFLKRGIFFPVNLESIFYEIDLDHLSADLGHITNTLELKQMAGSQSSRLRDLVGFIHSGSEYFPALIHAKWFRIAADVSYENKISSIADINEGLYGIPDNLDIAREYQQWILAAMNYCAFKRWWIFNEMKRYLLKHMPLQITLINDRCHAGLFSVEKQNKPYLLQSRGVQLIQKESCPYLIAGQRESVSYLVKQHTGNCSVRYLGHGTSYQTDDAYHYASLLGLTHTRQSLHYVKNLNANTPVDQEKCLAYTYNILAQKNYLERCNLDCVALHPFVNYHGRYLRMVAP